MMINAISMFVPSASRLCLKTLPSPFRNCPRMKKAMKKVTASKMGRIAIRIVRERVMKKRGMGRIIKSKRVKIFKRS